MCFPPHTGIQKAAGNTMAQGWGGGRCVWGSRAGVVGKVGVGVGVEGVQKNKNQAYMVGRL